jgi:hypothetical protein
MVSVLRMLRGVPLLGVGLVVGVLVVACGVAPGGVRAFPDSEHPFAIEPGSFHFTVSSLQAGAHSDWTTSFTFEHTKNREKETYNDLKTTILNLPAGFTGSSIAVPTCTDAELSNDECPPESQVGVVEYDETADDAIPDTFISPVYSLQSNAGVAATLGFDFGAGVATQILTVSVRPEDEGLTVTSYSIEDEGEPKKATFTAWGVPGSPEHQAQRGLEVEKLHVGGEEITKIIHPGGEVVHDAVRPFLSNPTRCSGEPLEVSVSADSWEEPFVGEPERWPHASTQVGPITGCERDPFSPSFEALPTTTSAESPSGLDASLVVPQTYEDPESLASSELQDTKVTLPEGMTINPSAGAGLGSCAPAQYAEETASSPLGVGCPPESKIGSIEIETPLLAEKLDGSVYVATPYDNPFGSLLALYVVAKDPERGLLLRVAGKIEPNPETGRLTSTFQHTPQQPFGRFTLKFRPGATAPLVSPPACGSYDAQAELAPYANPLAAQLVSSSPFTISQGVREGPCPAGGVPPFAPRIVSGTQNNAAGTYSPFYLRLIREDGEQELTRFNTLLPPGLTGNLTGLPFCPEADIEAARKATGREELEHPSCPAASEVGHTVVEAGVGTVLAQTPGRVYFAGPYHGAPYSLVSVTSATVGPFDLGTVVIRLALSINPVTAQVEVSGAESDPIPHIIDGIVVHVRDIRVYMDRPDFTINPTSCEPLAIQETITGTGADPANPADQVPVNVDERFQAADCASLAFEPKVAVSTAAKTSRADGASLSFKLSFPEDPFGKYANAKIVKVQLPKQLPSRLTTLQKACTRAQFDTDPAGCPAASVVGHVKATTPILPVPLEGPAYFVSNGSEAFPNLIFLLQGYGVTFESIGDTFISKAGITSSTFKAIPDVPLTSVEVTLPEGPDSALVADGDLCASTTTKTTHKRVEVKHHGHPVHRHGHLLYKTETVTKTEPSPITMPGEFTAQNGLVVTRDTPVTVTGCPTTNTTGKAKTKHGDTHAKTLQARN